MKNIGVLDFISVFVLRAEWQIYDVFKKGEYAGIGWFDRDVTDPDLEKWDLQDRDFLKQKYRDKYGEDEAYMRVN